MVGIYVESRGKVILDDIRAEDVIGVRLEAAHALTVDIIFLAVYHDRTEPGHIVTGHIDQGWLDDEAAVGAEHTLRNTELRLQVQIVADDLQFRLVHDYGLAGHLTHDYGLPEGYHHLAQLHVYLLTALNRSLVAIVTRGIEEQDCIAAHGRIVAPVGIRHRNPQAVDDYAPPRQRRLRLDIAHDSLNMMKVLAQAIQCPCQEQNQGGRYFGDCSHLFAILIYLLSSSISHSQLFAIHFLQPATSLSSATSLGRATSLQNYLKVQPNIHNRVEPPAARSAKSIAHTGTGMGTQIDSATEDL